MNRPDERFLDRAGARTLDRAAMDELDIPGIVLMENAARGATSVATEMVPEGGSITILAGTGNNGGDGWAMARLLAIEGLPVEIRTLGPPPEGSDAAVNEDLARTMELPIHTELEASDITSTTLVVDALFGTGLDRPISGRAAEWIQVVNASAPAGVLAVDLPSGLDADSGGPLGPTIQATRTVTFVARKCGMAAPGAGAFCGIIEVVGIGTPKSLLDRFAVPTPE